jgi:hypothetical protein
VPNHTVRGPTPRAFRTPATGAAAYARARHFHGDPTVGRRIEQAGSRVNQSFNPHRSLIEQARAQLRSVQRRLDEENARAAAPRNHFGAGSGAQPQREPVKRHPTGFQIWRTKVEDNLLGISAGLFVLGMVGWGWMVVNEFRSSVLLTTAVAAFGAADIDGRAPLSPSYARIDDPAAPRALRDARGDATPAGIVAREWSGLEASRLAEFGRGATKPLVKEGRLAGAPPIRLASLESAAPPASVFRSETQNVPSRIRPNTGAETSLIDFESAPFPYHGLMPGTNRPFLNAGEDGRRGHINFRGNVLWESQVFSDDRVLLHVPPGFDPNRPAVMVVFFHGHGADLARDVRDRQRVPAQITASGANAVLVAPQFAFDAADSSAGKFWEPNGFKRFLDEAAVKLARLYGDPRAAANFAKMPIVIVAYSGGFGPTLSVLDRGGVRSRIRGIVLLDALYAGIDRFADWIADNRSTFFVSAYTPHTAHHNTYLERLLSERAVAYGSELRRGHLPGMVTFLPAGDISHRDFVNHAWADYPIKDILARMDNLDPKVETADTGSAARSVAFTRN